MTPNRMFQVEQIKISHSFWAIPWLTNITIVKELRQKTFTHQPLPVYSIKYFFFINLSVLCRYTCCSASLQSMSLHELSICPRLWLRSQG